MYSDMEKPEYDMEDDLRGAGMRRRTKKVYGEEWQTLSEEVQVPSSC